MAFPSSSSAIARWLEIWSGKRGLQNVARDSGDACWRTVLITSGRATKRGMGKSLQNCAGAKEMMAMSMGGVDRRQILSARHNPIRARARLLDGSGSVD